MSTGVAAIERAAGRRRVHELLEREGLLVGVIAVYTAAVAMMLPSFVVQDTWFALLGGREVLHHGLPGADTLTYWTLGQEWVDQQWLGQSVSYAVFSAGGLKLLVLANAAAVVLALALAAYTARRLGAGSRATSVVIVCVAPLLYLVSSYARAQTLAYPLFVVLLGLLLKDARVPSRQVFLAVPILVLWANLHGSVVLGVALVALRAAVLILGRSSRARGVLLLAGGALAVLATPYGTRVVGYYHDTIFNPSFNTVVEWRAPALSGTTFPLYAVGGAAIWLLGRYHRRFTSFERLALLLLVVAAFWALRNVVWLTLGAIPLLAPTVEELFRGRRPAPPRTNVFLGLAASGLAVVAVASAALKPVDGANAQFSPGAAALIAREAKSDASLKIFANERYGDWLLFTYPELRGRVAYDIRFELLTKAQSTSISRWRSQKTDGWRAAARGARLLVLDPRTEWRNENRLLAEPGARRIYRDERIAVLLRSAREAG